MNEINFSESCKRQLDDFVMSVMESRFHHEVLAGRFSKMQVGVYLFNLHSLISMTPQHIINAHQYCEKKGDAVLSKFFADKLPEEEGHEQWAVDDISKLNLNANEYNNLKLIKTMNQMITYLNSLSARDPQGYLGYQFFAEYVTVQYAPILIDNLAKKCQINPACLSVLSNHVELDLEHAAHDMTLLDQHITTPADQARVLREIERAQTFLFNFIHELLELKAHDHKVASVN